MIKNAVKIVKYYYNLNKKNFMWIYVKMNLFLWYTAEFSASLLQSSVSHDLQKSFLNADYFTF